MPRYNWLSESQLQTKHLGDDLRALRAVGVPYTEDMIANASADALAQASPDDDTAGLVKRYGDATQIRSFDGDQRTVSEMDALVRSEEHTSELQSLMRISYAVFCLKKQTITTQKQK